MRNQPQDQQAHELSSGKSLLMSEPLQWCCVGKETAIPQLCSFTVKTLIIRDDSSVLAEKCNAVYLDNLVSFWFTGYLGLKGFRNAGKETFLMNKNKL